MGFGAGPAAVDARRTIVALICFPQEAPQGVFDRAVDDDRHLLRRRIDRAAPLTERGLILQVAGEVAIVIDVDRHGESLHLADHDDVTHS
jgi:hypothetical protein